PQAVRPSPCTSAASVEHAKEVAFVVEPRVEAPAQEAPKQHQHIDQADAVVGEVYLRIRHRGEGGPHLGEVAQAERYAHNVQGQVYDGGDDLAARHEVGETGGLYGSRIHQVSNFLFSS